jgi:hypothetical protein
VIGLVCTAALLSATLQDSSGSATTSQLMYSESAEGLQKLVEDIFAVIKSGDSERASAYFRSLALPDHGAWLIREFGPVEGPRLEAKYSELLPEQLNEIKGNFEYAMKGAARR